MFFVRYMSYIDILHNRRYFRENLNGFLRMQQTDAKVWMTFRLPSPENSPNRYRRRARSPFPLLVHSPEMALRGQANDKWSNNDNKSNQVSVRIEPTRIETEQALPSFTTVVDQDRTRTPASTSHTH